MFTLTRTCRIRAPFSITHTCDIHWPKQCESIVTLVSQHSSLQHWVFQTVVVHCGTINQGSCYISISSNFKYRAVGCETFYCSCYLYTQSPASYKIYSSIIIIVTIPKHLFVSGSTFHSPLLRQTIEMGPNCVSPMSHDGKVSTVPSITFPPLSLAGTAHLAVKIKGHINNYVYEYNVY